MHELTPASNEQHPLDAAWAEPPETAPEEQGTTAGQQLQRLVAAVLRYKWLILVLVVLSTGAGAVASRFMSVRYAVQARLWIQVPPRGAAERGPIQSGRLLDSFAWIDLLRSFRVLDQVVQDLRLYVQPESEADAPLFAHFRLGDGIQPGAYVLEVTDQGRLVLRSRDGLVIEEAAPGDSVGRALGFRWVPTVPLLRPGRTYEFTVRHPREVAQDLAGRIQTRMAREGTFLHLQLEGTNPTRLAATLNAVADRFVSVAAELKGAKDRELTAILADQLARAEQNLTAAEIELEAFKVQTITLPTERATPVAPGLEETRGPVFSNYFAMKIEQEQLRRDREALAMALADTVFSPSALEYIPAVQSSEELGSALQELTQKRAELRAQRYQYTDEYPPVRRLIAEIEVLEQQTIPRLAQLLIEQLDRRVAQIDGLIRSASTELEQIPPRALEEARLTRRVALAENLYTSLRQRYDEARLAAASTLPDVTILDTAAVPQRPIADQRKQVLLLAIAAGLGLGLVLAILLDRIDRRVRYPDQITQGLRLNILGAIPQIKEGNGRLAADTATQVMEAFRTLRLAVRHSFGSAGPVVATITSPGSGDGKSFVAANLALAFADQGFRTLLIDGDIRRGGLHRPLGVQRKPGLTDLLAGHATTEEVVQATEYRSLFVVGCGTRLPEGPELLGSPALAQALIEFRSAYSVILIDSPPLGAGVDPFILGTVSGNVMLVLRTGYTDREFAEAKIDFFDRLPVRVLGAVLNAVPASGVYRYYSYLPGYGTGEEVEAPEQKRLIGTAS